MIQPGVGLVTLSMPLQSTEALAIAGPKRCKADPAQLACFFGLFRCQAFAQEEAVLLHRCKTVTAAKGELFMHIIKCCDC